MYRVGAVFKKKKKQWPLMLLASESLCRKYRDSGE